MSRHSSLFGDLDVHTHGMALDTRDYLKLVAGGVHYHTLGFGVVSAVATRRFK